MKLAFYLLISILKHIITNPYIFLIVSSMSMVQFSLQVL